MTKQLIVRMFLCLAVFAAIPIYPASAATDVEQIQAWQIAYGEIDKKAEANLAASKNVFDELDGKKLDLATAQKKLQTLDQELEALQANLNKLPPIDLINGPAQDQLRVALYESSLVISFRRIANHESQLFIANQSNIAAFENVQDALRQANDHHSAADSAIKKALTNLIKK